MFCFLGGKVRELAIIVREKRKKIEENERQRCYRSYCKKFCLSYRQLFPITRFFIRITLIFFSNY